jgi:hypothetical protein
VRRSVEQIAGNHRHHRWLAAAVLPQMKVIASVCATKPIAATTVGPQNDASMNPSNFT